MTAATYAPQRNYSHPIDASIIRVLDNPAVNLVFRNLIAVTTDGYFGQILSTGVPVNEKSFPHLHKLVVHCADTLRISKPYVIVSNSVGFNAFTTGSDRKPYIVLGSTLVKFMTPEQLHFIIGHECGHIAMGHVIYQSAVNALAALAKNDPYIGTLVNSTAGLALNAWSRRSEITADRAGLLCCGDLEVAQKALLQIQMGMINAKDADVSEYVQNSSEFRSGGILRRLGEYGQSHPLLPKRIEALDLFMRSSLLFRIAGQEPPADALDDRELELQIEKLIKVL